MNSISVADRTARGRVDLSDCAPRRELTRRAPTPSRWRGRLLTLAGSVLAGVLFAVFVLPRLLGLVTPHVYHATVLQESEPAPSMQELRLASGDPVDLAAHRGDVVLVYFGYLNCPDVCPTTLDMTARALDELEADQRDQVRLVMVSVDPERDTAALVDGYAGFFDPSFFGATGDPDAVLRVATQYGVFYRANGADEDGHYFVDHTSALMAIDPGGALRLIWSPDATSDEIAADLRELVG